MCGIVACRTATSAAPYLVHALRLLEYRGYDSIGVAVRGSDAALVTVRSIRRVDDLAALLAARDPDGLGGVGIGHTRWATHGEVSERNAHPHRDCTGSLAVVHNGIIENATELRAELRGRGHEFASDVDSEVVCHLLEEHVDAGRDALAALEATVARLRGSWALVVLDGETGALVATAHGSPLVVAASPLGVFAASDVAAIADWVDEVVPLRDGDVVELSDEPRWMRAGVRRSAPAAVSAAPARRSVEPLDHPDFMAKEIAEQPAVAAGILDALRPGIERGRLWRELGLPDFSRVAVLGCGTSLNAGTVVGRAFSRLGGVPAEALVASEAAESVLPPGTLLLAFSQSGETADVLRALDDLDPGIPVLAVTNNPHSTLARRASSILHCLAGPEVGVAATKTFVAQVVTGVCAALSALTAIGRVPRARLREAVEELARAPERLARALDVGAATIPPVVARVSAAPGFVFLGRGAGVPYAVEGALKLKELSYRWAEAYPAGELKHGPLALVEPGTPVIAVDDGAPRLAGNLAEVAARGAAVVTIGGPGSTVPTLGAWSPTRAAAAPWGPLDAVVPLQMLARELALGLGRDVDKPRNLAKAVTVD